MADLLVWQFWVGLAVGLCVFPSLLVLISFLFLWLQPAFDQWQQERHRRT